MGHWCSNRIDHMTEHQSGCITGFKFTTLNIFNTLSTLSSHKSLLDFNPLGSQDQQSGSIKQAVLKFSQRWGGCWENSQEKYIIYWLAAIKVHVSREFIVWFKHEALINPWFASVSYHTKYGVFKHFLSGFPSQLCSNFVCFESDSFCLLQNINI